MGGKFFDNLFNKNKNQQPCNCPNCRGVQQEYDVEDMTFDVEMENPEDIISEYFAAVSNADSPEEVYMLLGSLFNEAAVYGAKDSMLDDINIKIQILNAMQNADDSVDYE